MKLRLFLVSLVGFAASLFGGEVPSYRRNAFTTNDVPSNVAMSNVTIQGTTTFTSSDTNFVLVADGGGVFVFSNGVTGVTLAITNGAIRSLDYLFSAPQRVYNLKRFGAKMDGVIGTNVSTTAGLTTITVGSGNLSTADAGKPILIYSVGTTYGFTNGVGVAKTYTNSFKSTISLVTAPNACTLADAVIGTIANTSAIWGSDDTAAWNLAIGTVVTNGGGTIQVPNGISCIASPVQDPIPNESDTNMFKNAQIVFPDVPISGQVSILVRIRGAGVNGPQQSIGPFLRQNSFGTLVVPMLVSTQRVALFNCENKTTWQFWSNPSWVQYKFGRRFNFFNPIRVEIEDMSFRFPENPNYFGLDLRGCDSAEVRNVFIDVGNAIGYAPYPQYTNSSVAVMMPEGLSSGVCGVNNLTVYGFRSGLSIGEHLVVNNYIALDCWNAVALQGGGHITVFNILDAEVCHNAINNVPLGGTGALFSLIANITGENVESTHWSYPSTVVNDPGNAVYGNILFENTQGPVTNNGAKNLLVQHFNYDSLGNSRFESNLRTTTNIYVEGEGRFGTVVITNRIATGLGALQVIGPDDTVETRIEMRTAPGGAYWHLEKYPDTAVGGGVYANAFNFRTYDPLIGIRATMTIGSNSLVHFLKGAVGMDVDIATPTPLKLPLGVTIGAGGNISDSASNSVVAIADNNNVKINPPLASGAVYLNYDRGTGTHFGNGAAGSPVATVDTNGNANFKSVTATNGTLGMASSLVWTNGDALLRNDFNNIVVNPPLSSGQVFLNYDRGQGVSFGNGAGSAIVASVSPAGAATFVSLLTTNSQFEGVMKVASTISSTNGNSILTVADRVNLKLDPPLAAGGTFINWSRGDISSTLPGLNIGNGAGNWVAAISAKGYQQATNAVANWPTAALTGGGFALVNSNATVYILTSTPDSTAWAATNKLAGP